MTQVDISKWIIHPKGSFEFEERKKRLREERQKKLQEVKRANIVHNDPNFQHFKNWLLKNGGCGEYINIYEFDFQDDQNISDTFKETSENYLHPLETDPFSKYNADIKTEPFLNEKISDSLEKQVEIFQSVNEKNIFREIKTKDNKLIEECKCIREQLLDIIRECTGYIFVRGWSGYRVNTLIFKSYCKQDKGYQVLKPREKVKKQHDPDNLKQFSCSSTFSIHFNIKRKTVKLSFCHKMKHDILPVTKIPSSLKQFISTNLCFTARECFESLKRTPIYAEFVKSFDAKNIVKKIWKEVSESQWNLDIDSTTSAIKILKRFEDTGEVSILSCVNDDSETKTSLNKSKPLAFIYEKVLLQIKEEVREIVIDSTFSLSTDFRQYFVVVANFFGKGVPVGFMATKTNYIDHLTVSWFLKNILKRLPNVRCINSDWSLAEIKGIKSLGYYNQICLFHTLTAIRCRRTASKNSLIQTYSKQLFKDLFSFPWVDQKKFDLSIYDMKYLEKITESQARSIIKVVRLAICDHILFHSIGKKQIFNKSDSDNLKIYKVYEYHLRRIYELVVERFSLPCFFCYLFNQYYNFTSFCLMSRVGKPDFFSNLRTSMMCESYFNQLKSWNLSGSKNYRIDTFVYILLHKDLQKIKGNVKTTTKFEQKYDSTNLVHQHNKNLPTWRKQWVIEWKSLSRERQRKDSQMLEKECEHYGTQLKNWLCSCDSSILSPSSSCLHLNFLYSVLYPNYHGFELQRFGKRGNGLPLIKHKSLEENYQPDKGSMLSLSDEIQTNSSFEYLTSSIEEEQAEKMILETEFTLSSDIADTTEDSEAERDLEIFKFFLSDEETKSVILQSPQFKSIIYEMTYVIKRKKEEPNWRPKTNSPEKGFKHQAWIRSLKYHQLYIDVKTEGSMPLPI